MPGKGTPPGEALYPECAQEGSAGPRRHRREGTVTCRHCRAETSRLMAQYRVRRIVQGPQLVPALGTARRVRALARIGWDQAEVGRRIGLNRYAVSKIVNQQTVRRTVAQGVAGVYRELAWEQGPNRLARANAVARGWPGPLDWDDIDNRDEVPACEIEAAHAEAIRFHREFRKMLAKRQKRRLTAEQRQAAQQRRQAVA